MSQLPPPPPGFALEQGAAPPPAPAPTPRVAPPLPDGFAIEHPAATLPATPPYAPGVTPPTAGAGIPGSAPPATVAAPPPEQPAPVEDAEGLYQRYIAGQGPSDAWLAAYANDDPRTEPPGWQVPMTPHQLPGQDGPGQPIQPPPAGFVLDPTSNIPPGAAPGPTSDQILASQMQAQHPGTQWVVSDDPRPAFAQAMEHLQTPAAQAAIANAPGGSQWVARETHNAGAQIVGELGKTASFLEQAGSKVPPSSMALYGSPTSASQPAPSPAETAAQQALSQKAESDRQAAQQLVDEHPVTSGLGKFAVAAAGMAPQLAATLAAPITAPLVWGVTGAASAYNRAKAAGASDATAGIESMWGGGIGALTSLVPGMGDAHPSFLRGLLQNAAAMGAQATADDLVARHGHGDPRTIQDILGDALTAAGVGALFHTVFHGPAALRSLPDKQLARQLGLDPSDPATVSVIGKMRQAYAAASSGQANPIEALQGIDLTPQEKDAAARVMRAATAPPAPATPPAPEPREYNPAALNRQLPNTGASHAAQAPIVPEAAQGPAVVQQTAPQRPAVQPVRPPAVDEPGPAAAAAGRPADAVAGPAAESGARAGAVRDAAPAADQEPGPARLEGQDAGPAEVSGAAVAAPAPEPFEIQRQRAAVRKAAALLDGGTLTPGELPIAQHALAKARAKLLDLQADHLISGGVPAAPTARQAELTPELAQAFGLGDAGGEPAQAATEPPQAHSEPAQADSGEQQAPPANAGALPATPKRKAPPRPFSKQDLQAQIQDAHREQGGGVPQDVHDFANTLANAFTFKRDGPYRGEVARHAGGKEAGKTGVAIMRSKAIGFTDDPAAAGGEDAINAFKDRYGPKGEDYYWQLVRDRAGIGFQDALQFARSSPDPQHQLMAAHYDAYQRGGTPKADVVPGAELETGEQFDSLGHPTRVVENADGERVLEDGGDIPPLPVDELSAVPVDKGTRQMAPEPELPEGDVFPAEHQPAFFDADKAGVSGQQTGVFGQPEFFGATGRGQARLQFETEPAKVAPPDTEGVGGSRNALDPRNTAEMFEPRPAAHAAAPRSTWEQRIVDAIHGGDVEQARKVIRTPRGRELFNAATGADVSANASPAERQAAVDQWASKREAGPTAALEVTAPQAGDLKAWGTYAANPHMTGGTLAAGLDNPAQGRATAVDFDAADPASSSGAGSLLGGAMEKVKAKWHALADAAKEFSGQMFPRTTRLDRASGEALARLVASPIYAEEAAPLAAEDVIGPPAGKTTGIDPEMDRLAGVVMVEDNLRGLASQLREQGDDDAADRVKTLVGGEGSPFADEAAYRAALHDPRVRDVVDRYRDWFKGEPEANYRVSQGIATDAELPNRGQQTDTRVNLIAVKAGEAPAAATVYAARRGRLTNPLKKPSPFAKKAYGTADGYDVRLSRMIENTLKKGTYTANLHRLYNTLVDRGLAVWGKPGERPTIKGQEGVPLRVDVRGQSQTLYMPRHVYGEVVRALKVDEPPRAGLLRLFAGVANHGALLSLSEGMTHLANAMGPLFRAPGGATNYARWAKDAAHLLVNDPAARRDLVNLARIGALPSRHALAGWQRAYPPAMFKHLIDGMTRAARLTMSSAFDRAVKAGLVDDTETARRDFVNQLGQYLKEAQGDFQRLARDTALGPFVTAGTNYVAQGFKTATLSNGLKGRTWAATAQLRLGVLGGMAAAIGAVAVLNWLRWKRADGAKDIPLGAVRLADGPGGKHRYWDPLRLLGITRAARDTGTMAVIEGKRRGETRGEITDHAARDVAVGLARPFAGPLVNAASVLATGKTPEGYQEARKAGPGRSQLAENAKAAARTLNPIVERATGGRGSLLGPFGVHENARAEESWATTRAREYVHEQEGGDAMTAEQSAAFDRREQLRAGLQKDRKAGTRDLVAALRRHEVTLAQAKEMLKDSGDADAVRYVRQIRDLNAALDVFRTAVSRDRDPAEVRALARVVAPMVARDAREGKITAEQMKAYNRELLKGIGHPAPAAKAG